MLGTDCARCHRPEPANLGPGHTTRPRPNATW
jgi:hypothetical protein